MANKSKLAFGSSAGIEAALASGDIDAYDILLLDDGDEQRIGWVDKNGIAKIVENNNIEVITDDSLPETGESEKIYIFKDELYYWNGAEFKVLTKSADLTALESIVETKVDEAKVQEMIDASSGLEVVEF